MNPNYFKRLKFWPPKSNKEKVKEKKAEELYNKIHKILSISGTDDSIAKRRILEIFKNEL